MKGMRMAEPNKPAAAKPVMAKKAVAKKPVAKKSAAKKAAPKKSAKKKSSKKAAKKVVKKAAGKPSKISPEERYRMVEVAAYFLAERNKFAGNPVGYWTAAEAQIKKMLS
jgi:Protein of unknown function (DUF2934)